MIGPNGIFGSAQVTPGRRAEEPAESRTRTEYYEARRAADGGSRADDNAGADEVRRADPAGTRLTPRTGRTSDALRVTPERATHILDGDATGGGHRHGAGKPGKTEFPAGWDDRKIIDTVLDVARGPMRRPAIKNGMTAG